MPRPQAGRRPEPRRRAKAFLANNAKQPGVVVLPDGLQYKIVQSGPATGGKPQLNDEVKVNYEGKLIDGKVFDSSYERGQPAAMPLKRPDQGLAGGPAADAAGRRVDALRPAGARLRRRGRGRRPDPRRRRADLQIELIDFLPGPGRVAAGR